MSKVALSRSDAARVLLAAIEDVAQICQDAAEVQRRSALLIEGQRRLYTAITGEEAPEFRMVSHVVAVAS